MTARGPATAAFTLVEALVVVAILGIVASVVVPTVLEGPDAAKKTKLDQDVVVVNNAIDAYITAGGSQAALTAGGVIEALKQRVSGRVTGEMTGSLGPFLDPRVVTNASDFGWSARYDISGARPRFVVQNSPNGVVFGRGLPSAVAPPVAAAKPDWLWSYTPVAAAPVSKPIFEPGTIDSGTTLGTTNRIVTVLAPPVISPAGGTISLTDFPQEVTISNPNPQGSSIVYVRVDNGPWQLYVGLFQIRPAPDSNQVTVTAVAVSIDPSRYYNSAASTETYSFNPLQLVLQASPATDALTYAEALAGFNATISLNMPDLDPAFTSSQQFEVFYTIDGTEPMTSGTRSNAPSVAVSPHSQTLPLDLAAWGSGNSMQVRAVANAINQIWFSDSAEAVATFTIEPTQLNPPTITPPAGRYFGSIPVTITAAGDSPGGGLVYYTTTGAVPANGSGNSFVSSTNFSLPPISFGQTVTVQAVAVGPTNYTHWFLPSSVTSVVYSGPNFNYGAITGGVLISGGTIGNNASLRGSVVIARVTNGTQPNLTFNNNTALTGDIFAPGTPSVVGVPAGRVINLDGEVNPTGYTVTIGSGVTFGGNVYRRITPVNMPSVSLPTGLTPRGSASSGTLQPGYYTRINPGNNATVTLGVAGSTTPSVYVVDNFSTGNGARINVVGPVILVLNPGAAATINIANNVVVGNSTRPDWLQLRMYTGNLTLGNNGFLYGTVLAPNGTVIFENNSTFNGAVTANTFFLNNNGAGITFSLPPPQ